MEAAVVRGKEMRIKDESTGGEGGTMGENLEEKEEVMH